MSFDDRRSVGRSSSAGVSWKNLYRQHDIMGMIRWLSPLTKLSVAKEKGEVCHRRFQASDLKTSAVYVFIQNGTACMIQIFDTETTGLPRNWKAPMSNVDNWQGYRIWPSAINRIP